MQTLTSRQLPEVLEMEDIQKSKSSSYVLIFCLAFSFIAYVTLAWSEQKGENTSISGDAGKLFEICQKYASDHKGMFPRELDDLVIGGYVQDEALIYRQTKWGGEESRWIYQTSPQVPAHPDSTILFTSSETVHGKDVVVFYTGKIVELAVPTSDSVSRAQVWPRHIFDH